MKQKETVEQGTSHHWSDLLNAGDKEKLTLLQSETFPWLMKHGYEILVEIPSGQLLRPGPFVNEILVHEVQRKVAHQIIDRLERSNAEKAEYDLWAAYGRGEGTWKPGDDRPLPTYEILYKWDSKAIVPPEGWQTKTRLTVDDLSVDYNAVTIFTKKDPTS